MKKNTIFLVTAIVISLFIAVTIIGQNRNTESAVTDAQVKASLQTFSQLLTNETIGSFGLKNAGQLKSLKPGKRFTNYMIGLNDVRKYKAGDDVNQVIKELPSVEIALTDEDNRFVTSVEFTKTKDGWQATGFGATPELKTLYNSRNPIPDTVINNGKLVRIPSLHSSFIAVSSASGLNFIVTEDNESLNFRRGMVISSDNALLQLSKAAKIYNGLPD